jgi:ankyrin repeat protein
MGWDGLADAEALGHGDVVEIIQDRRAKEDALILAIVQGHPDWAIRMVDEDSTLVNTHNNWHGHERTPLMHAAEQGSVELVEALLSRGADVFAENSATSVNALTHAIYHGHDEIAQMLREKGAESGDVTNYLMAARKGNVGMARHYLDERGVDVNAKDACLRHVLPEAFRSGNRALLDLLFERGADPNMSRGWEDYLWLLAHVRKGETHVVRTMLDHGCDPSSAWGGKSLLETARENDRDDIVALLLDAGATE